MRAKTLLWKADLENGNYQNPILFTDYSDPDVIRVGDTFFMTASSFNCVPGLPILVSKDLVHWQICNYAIKNLPFETYDRPAHGKGIWAPSIRFHDEKYWIFVGMPDEGIFMTNTEDPYGDWSPLTCVWSGKGFIDPCPYWEEDGSAYIIHAYAKSRIGFKSKLGIFAMSNDGTTCIGKDRFLFDGTETQPTIEGPKVYKRGNYYYIFAPAGGVTSGWQTVLRSTSLQGPFEEKIVMHQGSTKINGPHQGGLVDTPDKSQWFLHFQDRGVYGRILYLQPVNWVDNWPVIGEDSNKEGIGEPVSTYKKPSGCAKVNAIEPESSDDFLNGKLGLSWQWMGNVKDGYYSMTDKKDYLRLFAVNPTGCPNEILWNCSNLLTQKIMAPAFCMITKFDISSLCVGEKTGVTVIGGNYAFLAVKKKEDNFYLQYVVSYLESKDVKEKILWETELKLDVTERKLWFHIQFYETGKCKFSISTNGKLLNVFKDCFYPQKGIWMGAKVGLFALKDEGASKGYVDIEYVHFNMQDFT